MAQLRYPFASVVMTSITVVVIALQLRSSCHAQDVSEIVDCSRLELDGRWTGDRVSAGAVLKNQTVLTLLDAEVVLDIRHDLGSCMFLADLLFTPNSESFDSLSPSTAPFGTLKKQFIAIMKRDLFQDEYSIVLEEVLQNVTVGDSLWELRGFATGYLESDDIILTEGEQTLEIAYVGRATAQNDDPFSVVMTFVLKREDDEEAPSLDSPDEDDIEDEVLDNLLLCPNITGSWFSSEYQAARLSKDNTSTQLSGLNMTLVVDEASQAGAYIYICVVIVNQLNIYDSSRHQIIFCFQLQCRFCHFSDFNLYFV